MSEDYTSEAEAERAGWAEEQLAADRLEASSIRYGVWLRVAYLTSGHWAVYHDTEASGGKETGIIEIFESLDIEYLRGLSINERAKLEERRLANLARIESRSPAPVEQKASQNLEEMGL